MLISVVIRQRLSVTEGIKRGMKGDGPDVNLSDGRIRGFHRLRICFSASAAGKQNECRPEESFVELNIKVHVRTAAAVNSICPVIPQPATGHTGRCCTSGQMLLDLTRCFRNSTTVFYLHNNDKNAVASAITSSRGQFTP